MTSFVSKGKSTNTLEMKKYYVITTAVFFASIAAGYVFALLDIDGARSVFMELASILSVAKDFGPLETFLFIFLNNSSKALAIILLGFFFGIIPLLSLGANGLILGVVLAVIQVDRSGKAVLGAILSLLPHGIFEMPAIIICSGLGLMLGVKFFRLLVKKEPFRHNLKLAMLIFCKLALPLITIAAVAETFISPHVTDKLLP